MNIDVLVANLENTIAGKQMLLESLSWANPLIREMVQINIEELQRILADVREIQKNVETNR